MWIIKHKTIFFIISTLLVVAAIVGFAVRGLNVGIEFTGGAVLELAYETTPEITDLHEAVDTNIDYPVQLQPFGETGIIVRTRDITEAERQELLATLSIIDNEATIERFNTVGPSVGKELRRKAIIALVVVMLAIILFVAWAFRSLEDEDEDEDPKAKSKQIGPSSWSYGLIAVIALLHDILIPIGIFLWLGLEVNSLFVVGLLSILGLSVNDTIVVFDRVREKVRDAEANNVKNAQFDQMVGDSITQTVTRSLNTSLTLLVALLALYFVGPVATQDLALVMILGTIVGTYSSIFLASPLLVMWAKRKKK